MGNNCIAFEDTSSLPTADLHNHPLSNSSPSKVSSRSPTQIVKEQCWNSSSYAGFIPSVAEIPNSHPIRPGKEIILRRLALDTRLEQVMDSLGHGDFSAFFVFCCARVQPNYLVLQIDLVDPELQQ